MIAIAEDILEAREAQVETHANDILRNLHNYEDLLGRMAANDKAQEALHDLANLPDALVMGPERKLIDALQAAAMEKAREELS